MMMMIIIIIIIIIIIGATGTTSKSLGQYLSNILGKHEIKKQQKTATLGTVYILRKILMLKHKTYFTREITLSVAQTVNTEQLQLYVRTLETRFVSHT